jgi:hypothetical protein
MSEFNQDKEILEGRKNPLKDDPKSKLVVVASLRDQQLDKLAKKLEELEVGQKVVNLWQTASAERQEWNERQQKFLQEIDEFIEPIYAPALDWSSTIHLPTILTLCKTFHGRFYAALMSLDPPFTMKGRREDAADRALLATELMRYTIYDWVNEYEGIDEAVDRWLWDWVTKGNGILKARWHKRFSRFMDVDSQMVEDIVLEVDPVTGDSIPVPTMKEVQKEVTRTVQRFSGPMLEVKNLEDIVIIGGDGDPQKADYVIEQGWFTASDLWSLSDQKLFNEECVRELIESGKSSPSGLDSTSQLKQIAASQAGNGSVQKVTEIDRYKIFEAYLKIDVDGLGIASDVIVWVAENTKDILRATYLQRVMPEGLLPYAKIGFHKRHGQQNDVGLVELLYSLGKEIDAMHNIKVDVGILSSMPIGFYRPTAASLKEESLPIEPGALIPVDNPQSDIYFPNLGTRWTFGANEEAALMQQIERLTSISDLNLGVIGGQGAARTATGARALLGESSNNLNIYIQRMNRGWKRALNYIWAMLQHRLEPDFQFRVTGDDGNSYFRTVKTREEIAGKFDFELEANSANSNKQVQVETANMIVQLTSNPIDLQLGIVTPSERFEALRNMLIVNGVKDISKYLRKPQGAPRALTPIEMMNRILHGMPCEILPTEDLQGFIDLVQHVMEDDMLLGQFGPHEVAALAAKAQEAQGMMQAMQQMQAQQSAAAQQSLNTQAAQQPANNQPVSVMQQPAQGEGG